MGMKSTGGEIVQVQGGHIVRATGRKDRHSKVFTAKGPRDRRVRLSAHTAIQFYDVQDRLGYDRPSKAVDWLIKKAKSAIDKLAELPPWNPTDITATAAQEEEQRNGGSGEMAIAEESESSGYNFQLQRQMGENPDKDLGFIPPQIDTDAIAFFPTSSATSSIDFHGYPTDIISRNTNSSEDLGLSLHFSQNPGLIHGQAQGNANETASNDHQTLFSNSNPVGFEANYQRIVNWNNETSIDINRGGFILNSPPLLGQGSILSQRGTLQSTFSPSVRVWNEIPISISEHQKSQSVQQASIFGSRFLSDGFAGFCFPARIQGEAENDGVGSDRPSSGSAHSHH